MAAKVFTHLRGYDEDCHGSGYQDVDFSRRCAAAVKTGLVAAPHKFQGVHNVTLTDSHAIIGYPIANVDMGLDDLKGAHRREERNGAKVRCCRNRIISAGAIQRAKRGDVAGTLGPRPTRAERGQGRRPGLEVLDPAAASI